MAIERTLYWYPSLHPQKVRLALNALELPHTVRRVDLAGGEQRTEAFLALNPLGKAPVLVDNGFALPESNAIVAYLGERYGLWPKGYQERAEALRWLFIEAHYLREPAGDVWFHRFFMPLQGGPSDESVAARGETEMVRPLKLLETRLAASSWLMGNEMTLVDCAYGPVLDAAELGGFSFAPYPRVATYLERLRALKAWQMGEFWTAADLARQRAAVAA
jgi:glutathione S-transferase